MNVRHRVVLLLVAGVVEFPLVDEVELGSQVQLVVLNDLLDPVLSVADDIEELVVKEVSI